MLFFSADLHLEHDNLITKLGRKGFTNPEEHAKVVMENINNKVGPKDTLVIIGDFSWKNPAKHRMQIKCKNVIFILGNHDNKQKSRQTFGPNLIESKTFKLFNGALAVCCHYPMIFWDKSHHGSYHFYGHMHNNREKLLNDLFPERRSMDVGIDSAIEILGRAEPFSEVELMEILKDRKGHDNVEYYKALRGQK